jgi:hypothetical protein
MNLLPVAGSPAPLPIPSPRPVDTQPDIATRLAREARCYGEPLAAGQIATSWVEVMLLRASAHLIDDPAVEFPAMAARDHAAGCGPPVAACGCGGLRPVPCESRAFISPQALPRPSPAGFFLTDAPLAAT